MNVSKCKKSEDASIPLLATCSHTKEQLLVQAKILKENLRLLDKVIDMSSETKPSVKRPVESNLESLECSKYISENEELIDFLLEDPLRPVVTRSLVKS